MKIIFMGLLSIFIIQGFANAQMKDFGVDGLKGLTEEHKKKLSNGDIIIITTTDNNQKSESRSALIEAAVVFNNKPQKAWELISKTEEQPKYIKECKEIKVVSKTSNQASEVHTVGALFFRVTYGVIQNYDPDHLYMHWILDKNYPKNGLESLYGYWQLYPYDKDKTIARYGSNVALKNVPEFLENMFKKSGVKNALIAVKKYIDSNGVYRK
ncbi:MAG: SRPBCC family protein [Desulfobacterales bacterium]|nr:SRPBCC family protein [Desulfobacterales bacterium]MBF0397293.1 SRPBCC family protein [Desulfobacterales bacterium]